jgi:hypothetical protein
VSNRLLSGILVVGRVYFRAPRALPVWSAIGIPALGPDVGRLKAQGISKGPFDARIGSAFGVADCAISNFKLTSKLRH